MFVAYTDASIKGNEAYLAFLIVLEDKNKIIRKIVVNESDSNIAEALAISELLSFLRYYNLKDGILLFDSNGVKKQLRRKNSPIHKHNRELKNLNVRTQLINRKINLAHRICRYDKYFPSHPISVINRRHYQNIYSANDLYLQPSVLNEYREIYNKRYATFHEVQMKLNKKILLTDLVEKNGEVRIYEINDRRIYVYGNTIIKLSRINCSYEKPLESCKKEKKLNKLSELEVGGVALSGD